MNENITKAIISVMKDVKGIEKSMTVGNGTSSYKGVPDQEVKKIIGNSMAKNGLALIPTSVTPNIRIDRWDEETQYGKKQKQSVMTEVTTKYLLIHESGESLEVAGYGHGVDSQDKGAGKATTYALKYTLLYLFLVPTGKIDDADNTHSDEVEMPKNISSYNHKSNNQDGKPLISNALFGKLIDRVKTDGKSALEKAQEVYSFESSQLQILQHLL